MKRSVYFVLCLAFRFSILCEAAETDKRPVDWVNPLIDTHDSRWFYFSSASRPFGMVNLSPDTNVQSSWHSGYVYESKTIRCFSHIHAWQLSGIPVMPTTGDFKGHLGMDAYQSAFSHDDEIVKPGYHKVVLKDYDIAVELTSTARVGFHKYTFPKSNRSYVLFDTGAYLAHGPVRSSQVRRISDTEIVGYSVTTALRTGLDGTERRRLLRPKDAPVYFAAILSKPFQKFSGWKGGELIAGDIDSASGKNVGGYVQFDTAADEVVMMKVAISYTSVEQARLNLRTELPHWDFDKVKNESIEEWNDWLSRIEVEGGSDKQKVKFYTDVWHALLGRRTLSDVDGRYCDMTGPEPVIRQVNLGDNGNPLYPHLNFDALWGAHWSCNILWSMAYPKVMSNFCNTMLDMYRDGGMIPRGPSGGNYSFVMIGDPAASFFACAYNKGIRNYDVEEAYEGLRKNAFPGGIRDRAGYEHFSATGGGIGFYIENGYVPEDLEITAGGHKDGAAMTLEYAYQDWCLAQFAKSLGKGDDYEMFMERSLNYHNLWDPSVKLMRPRARDGQWVEGTDHILSFEDFCEGNTSQYSNFVPHDIAGLSQLFGGRERHTEFLDYLFEQSEPSNFRKSYVNFSNQPATGMAHLFNYTGAPWLSQKWVRTIKEVTYGDITPYGGYNGDEDQGQMGSLGALMAMGLFELRGGAGSEPIYEITSPVFDKVTIHLDPEYYPGKTFVIETKNNSKENRYIQSAKLNGKFWNRCWFYHKDFSRGGKLELELGPDPNKKWGSAVEDAPPSMTEIDIPAEPADAGPIGWDLLPEILDRIVPPAFPDRDFAVTDYGAVGNGAVDCNPAFRKAIAACTKSGGGSVIVPKGTWLSNGPIHLDNNVNLHVSAGATIKFGTNYDDYLPHVRVRWAGTECYNYSPLIYAYKKTNIAVTGSGTIDGQAKSSWVTWQSKTKPGAIINMDLRKMGVEGTLVEDRIFYGKPSLIMPFDCMNVLIEGVTLNDYPFWCVHPVFSTNVTVRKLRIESHNPNNDGINPDSSKDILIEDCYLDQADDDIAIKGGRDQDGWRAGRACENIVIRNMNDWQGVAIGSECSGDVRNIFVYDCEYATGRVMYCKSNLDRGGAIENIYVKNLNVESSSLLTLRNDYHGYRGGNYPTRFRNINIEDVTIDESGSPAISILGVEGTPVNDVFLKNITIKRMQEPITGIRHAHNVVLTNVRVNGELQPTRPKPLPPEETQLEGTATIAAARSGLWSDTSIWNVGRDGAGVTWNGADAGRLPDSAKEPRVIIGKLELEPAGVTVILDTDIDEKFQVRVYENSVLVIPTGHTFKIGGFRPDRTNSMVRQSGGNLVSSKLHIDDITCRYVFTGGRMDVGALILEEGSLLMDNSANDISSISVAGVFQAGGETTTAFVAHENGVTPVECKNLYLNSYTGEKLIVDVSDYDHVNNGDLVLFSYTGIRDGKFDGGQNNPEHRVTIIGAKADLVYDDTDKTIKLSNFHR